MAIKDNLKAVLQPMLTWVLITGVMYIFTLMELPLCITNLFFVMMTCLCMYKLWKENSESRAELVIILLGILIRLLVCLIDIYGTEFITIPFSGDDSLNFYNTSVEYYYGDTSHVYTNYPYVLNAIYQVAGLNRFAAQYVNILCWCFCALIIQKSCYLLKIDKILRIAAVTLCSFLPFNICISSILMRDMIVTLSITLTTYCLLKWMVDGKHINLILGVLATAPTILIHNCVLAMLGVLVVVTALYSPMKRKFCIEKKIVLIMLAGLGAVMLVFFVPKLRQVFLNQIPVSNGGILAAINGRLEFFYTYSGGSTYLMNDYVSSYAELFFGTFKRIAYFLFSPVPTLWRSFSDIIGFFASASVFVSAIITMIVSTFYKQRDAFRTVLFLILFFVSGIFAWGVSNGGTAMRHREKILGITILLLLYSIQIIRNVRKGVQ